MSTALPTRNETDSIESAIREFGFGAPAPTRASIESSQLQQARRTVEVLTSRVDSLADELADLKDERERYGSMLGPTVLDIEIAQINLDRARRELTDAKLFATGKQVAA